MLFSVIIPCYNASRRLSRTLDSILCQNFNNYEIILINDGSTDNTLDIIKEYAAKYNCIRYIDQPNKGVSVARNVGISIAKGSYLSFIDSDDVITSNYFDIIANEVENNYDIVFFGFRHYKNESKFRDVYIQSHPDNILYNFVTYRAKCNLWNAVYNTDFIRKQGICFDEKTYYNEDKEFLIKAIVKSSPSKMGIIKGILYHYLYNPSSVMHQEGYSLRRFSSIDAHNRIYRLLIDVYGENSVIVKAYYSLFLHAFIAHKKTAMKSSNYNDIRGLFVSYSWLIAKLPPYVHSIFYYHNVITMVLDKDARQI